MGTVRGRLEAMFADPGYLTLARSILGSDDPAAIAARLDAYCRDTLGAIADRLADRVVLTSDNPRGEPPRAIADAIRAGAPSPRAEWVDELDRRAAIDRAITEAAPRDVVVIAGKGHEDYQEINGVRRPYSDRHTVRTVLETRA